MGGGGGDHIDIDIDLDLDIYIYNVVAHLIIGGVFNAFFFPYSSRDQKNDRLKYCVFLGFFLGGGVLLLCANGQS